MAPARTLAAEILAFKEEQKRLAYRTRSSLLRLVDSSPPIRKWSKMEVWPMEMEHKIVRFLSLKKVVFVDEVAMLGYRPRAREGNSVTFALDTPGPRALHEFSVRNGTIDVDALPVAVRNFLFMRSVLENMARATRPRKLPRGHGVGRES